MQVIYVEQELINHPRVKAILQRFKTKKVITCDHYGEIFNRKAQNFRLQKQNPALILASKKAHRVLPAPDGFGIGDVNNYYFSHLLNCPYDCRYCFLQGMYRSAHYVLFVNYEEYMDDIRALVQQSDQPCCFFTGYDADSLAYEPVSAFAQQFLPFFQQLSGAMFEFRTKSVNVRELLRQPVVSNCIIAFSFTPQEISDQAEHGVPSVQKRLTAMQKLAEHGWRLGVRLDPLIYHEQFKSLYRQLIDSIFSCLPIDSIHSVSLGPLRFPSKMYQKIVKLYPNEPLLRTGITQRDHMHTYNLELEDAMNSFVRDYLHSYIDESRLFSCHAS